MNLAGPSVFGLILSSSENQARQKVLRAEMIRSIEAVKDAQASFASRKSDEMQCEQLSLQGTMNEKLNMLISRQKTEDSGILYQQAVLPTIAVERSCDVAES